MRTPTEIREAFTAGESLTADRPFYLVGIGGAGMSALARMLKNRGLNVRGSDAAPSANTASLETLGVPVRLGHSEEDVRRGDQVVLSDAIELAESPEVRAAMRLDCPLFRRSQLLGWLMRGKKVIAVTGTHGKTTVTGMIGAALRAAGANPTIVVGAEVPEFGGLVVEGVGEYAVVEACEAYDSFHDLVPHMVVLTNLEPDHLDFHGTFDNLKASVGRFVESLPPDGKLVFNAGDRAASELAKRIAASSAAPFGSSGQVPSKSGIALPGLHNRQNAEAARVAVELLVPGSAEAASAIATFQGAQRRLQVVREGLIEIVDDYAHHPTEIRAAIGALREKYPGRRLVVVFQPHLFSRTAQLTDEFADALALADRVVLTDIYPAREEPIPGVSSARIADKIGKKCEYVPSRHLLPRRVARMAKEGDVVVGMGAGNIDEFVPALIAELDRSGPTRVAVVYGGDSTEREVSLHSGRSVCDALRIKGYDAYLADVSDMLLSKGDLSQFVGARRPDVAFLAVHGTNAEDGAIQGLFELLHIPYTGAGIHSSALAMDKQLTKDVLAARGFTVPAGELVFEPNSKIAIPPPLVVKPNAQGSTVGVSFVDRLEDLREAIERALAYGSGALVEERILGTEISIPVLGGRALPAVEIVPATGVYDFASKYLPGATDEICPARLPESVLEEAARLAVQAHHALRCSGATRIDFMVRGEEIFFLELNTIPGFTGTSLLPKSAETAGISFAELCDWIVRDALEEHAKAEQA